MCKTRKTILSIKYDDQNNIFYVFNKASSQFYVWNLFLILPVYPIRNRSLLFCKTRLQVSCLYLTKIEQNVCLTTKGVSVMFLSALLIWKNVYKVIFDRVKGGRCFLKKKKKIKQVTKIHRNIINLYTKEYNNNNESFKVQTLISHKEYHTMEIFGNRQYQYNIIL